MTTIQLVCRVIPFSRRGPAGMKDLKKGVNFEEFYDTKHLKKKGKKKLLCVFHPIFVIIIEKEMTTLIFCVVDLV